MMLAFPMSILAERTDTLCASSISGIVMDQSSNPLIGATVMLKDFPRGAMTDALGHYFITRIPSGTYDVVAVMVGMTPDTVFDVRLAADDSLTMNFTLGTGRHWPAFPMIDTVYSSQIIKTEWYHYDYRYHVDRTDSSQLFSEDSSIDWYSHPGEVRLELEEHCILDTCTNFRMLQSYDLNRDGFQDILGISIEGDQRWTYHPSDFCGRSVHANKVHFIVNDPSQPAGWRVLTSRCVWPINSINMSDNESDTGITIICSVTANQGIITINTDRHVENALLGGYSLRPLRTDYSTAIHSVDAIDYDGDGVLEYVAVDKDNSKVMLFQRHMLERDFTMLFTRFPHLRGEIDVMYNPDWEMELISDEITSPHSLLLRDLNNDGSIDILVASREDNALTWFSRFESGDSTISWQMHVIGDSTFHPRTVDIADINGDGNLDIVAAGDSIGYWLNTGLPFNRWVRGTIIPSYYHAKRIACEDVDEDGDIDLLASGENGLSLFQNNGREPSSWSETLVDGVYEGGYQALEAVDMNRDGVLDIVSLVSGQIKWWQNHFSPEGRLESAIITLGGMPLEAEIDWVSSSTETLNLFNLTSITFRFRSSNDSQNMGEWSEEILSPGDLMPYLNEHTRHIQYEVILRTEHPDVSPVLHELTINYSYLDSVRAPQPPGTGMILY
jgi:hypothetical protein